MASPQIRVAAALSQRAFDPGNCSYPARDRPFQKLRSGQSKNRMMPVGRYIEDGRQDKRPLMCAWVGQHKRLALQGSASGPIADCGFVANDIEVELPGRPPSQFSSG